MTSLSEGESKDVLRGRISDLEEQVSEGFSYSFECSIVFWTLVSFGKVLSIP